jgi:hypothetical protein
MPLRYGPTAPDAVRCGASASIAAAWAYRSLSEAVAWQVEALRRADLEGDRRITAVNCARLAHLQLLTGDVSTAADLLQRARELVSSRVSARWEDIVSLVDALLARHEGRHDDAERILRSTVNGAVAAGRVLHALLAGVALADLCLDTGRPDEAELALDRAASVGFLTDPAHVARLEVRRARIDREVGRTTEAVRRLDMVAAHVEVGEGMPPERSLWLLELASLASAAGGTDEALQTLSEMDEGLGRTGVTLPPWEVERVRRLTAR